LFGRGKGREGKASDEEAVDGAKRRNFAW